MTLLELPNGVSIVAEVQPGLNNKKTLFVSVIRDEAEDQDLLAIYSDSPYEEIEILTYEGVDNCHEWTQKICIPIANEKSE